MIGPSRGLLVVLHFLCPLLFFTNLTRNPYFTQIVLLNAGILVALGWTAVWQLRSGRLQVPRLAIAAPLAAFVAVCGVSWLYAYFGHAAFYRDAMRSEGLRMMFFTVVNAFVPCCLASLCAEYCPEEPDVQVGKWAFFVVAWILLWSAFPQFRARPSTAGAIWPLLWDSYGALVWAVGLGWVLWLARSGSVHALWHVILAVGFLAAVYGVGQYFTIEFFWPKILDPYGGRSVSTFGNPNFLSSYLVMVIPLAVTYYLVARTRLQRAAYAVVLLALEASLLCSLTRSSWAGAVAAVAPLLLSRRLRELARSDLEFHGLVFAALVLMALAWPQSSVAGYAPSVVGRLTEMGDIFKTASTGVPYHPLHQRLLIWMCAWTMGAENPFLGKGWGLFELFYPFYQGHFLDLFAIFRPLRTHANNAHNELLEIWAQAGLLGLSAFFWLWTAYFRKVWGSLREAWDAAVAAPARGAEGAAPSGGGKRPRSTLRAAWEGEPIWMLAASAGVLGMLVDNLLNVSLHFAVPAFLFWWQVGTVTGHLSIREGRVWNWEPVRRAGAWAGVAALCAACAWGGNYWYRQWNREVEYFLGFKFMRQGSMRQAIEHLDASYRSGVREVNAIYELGNAYARSEQSEKAVWGYTEALKANAGYDEIYFNRGTILSLRLNRPQEALRDYMTSWAINPLSEQVYTNFAALLLQGDVSKNKELALKLLERAVHFFPENTSFLINLGALHFMQGDYVRAEETYTRLLRLHPEALRAEQSLRETLAKSGRPAPAILEQSAAFRRLGERLGRREFDAESLRLARQVAEWFPRSAQARFYLANLELSQGDAAKAEKLLREVLAAEPGNLSAMMNLAQILKRTGRASGAAELLRSALRLDPNNAFAKSELAALGL